MKKTLLLYTAYGKIKGNVWTLNEAELSHIIIEGKKREDYSEYEAHYMNIIRPVFDVQYLNREDEKRVAELEKEVGYIKEDIYEFVEDDEECGGHCDCGHCGGCEE